MFLTQWCSRACCRGRLLVVYNLFPDYERVDSWAKRIRFYTWYSRSKNVITHLEKHQWVNSSLTTALMAASLLLEQKQLRVWSIVTMSLCCACSPMHREYSQTWCTVKARKYYITTIFSAFQVLLTQVPVYDCAFIYERCRIAPDFVIVNVSLHVYHGLNKTCWQQPSTTATVKRALRTRGNMRPPCAQHSDQ